MYMHNNHCHRATAHLQLSKYIIIIVIVIIIIMHDQIIFLLIVSGCVLCEVRSDRSVYKVLTTLKHDYFRSYRQNRGHAPDGAVG
jgi:hypothetical protein